MTERVECLACGEPFAIPLTGQDQVVTCPACGQRMTAHYDAEHVNGSWRGGSRLVLAATVAEETK